MSIQEKELKGILRSLKAINASLGTVTNTDLLQDVQAWITAEAATNVILDAAVVAEAAVNTDVDLAAALVGTGTAGLSFADQTTLLEAQLE